MSIASNDRRTLKGRFAKGHSGNPAGRPKGTRGAAVGLAYSSGKGEAEARIRDAVDRALAGDGASLVFCLDILFPESRRAEFTALFLQALAEHRLSRRNAS